MDFIPNFFFHRIADIPLSFFLKEGIKGAILDVDNTLTADESPDVSKEVQDWINRLKESGVKPIVVSNNHQPRVSRFADRIGLPYVHEAGKPSLKSLPQILSVLELNIGEIVVIGDQIFTDTWFAKRAGIRSVLLEPIGKDVLLGVKIKRILEKPFMKRIKRYRG